MIDDRAVHQVVEGFGASMTDSSAYLLNEVLPAANLPAVMQALFDRAHVSSQPQFVRMTVADRKAALTPTDLRSAFYTDTQQDPVAGTATINLNQGLVAPSSRTNETVGNTGDNLMAPITFGVDAAWIPVGQLNMKWTLSLKNQTVNVPQGRLWVMGDNRTHSADSRAHCTSTPADAVKGILCTGDPASGTVPVSNVIGKARFIVWPPSRWGGVGSVNPQQGQ